MATFSKLAFFAFTLTLVGALAACSSDDSASSGGKGGSGIDTSRSLDSLSSDERSALCDWSLEAQGGAGKVTECGGGESREVHTKQRCLEDMEAISKLADCVKITVAEIEKCSTEEGKGPCEDSATCEDLNQRVESCAGK